tara:strand:- start:5511 stop:6077 length:567 start_codon:yes stop_codon:yes gene_type:complete
MNNYNKKEELRKEFKEQRQRTTQIINHKIYQNVEDYVLRDNYCKSNIIGIYWPLGGEIDIRLLNKKGISKTALPSSNNNGLIDYRYWNNGPFKKDSKGILFPKNGRILSPEEISFLLIPALAIDKKGYRLGYGGGFYDRLRAIKEWRDLKAIIVVPKNCISDEPLPIDKWDIPFNGWIDETGYYNVSF